jgi:predicted RNase H-like HicB family nuclease
MLIRIGIEEQLDGTHKAFVPGLNWAWALGSTSEDATRRLKLVFLATLVDEYANNSTPIPMTLTFTVDVLPKIKEKADDESETNDEAKEDTTETVDA